MQHGRLSAFAVAISLFALAAPASSLARNAAGAAPIATSGCDTSGLSDIMAVYLSASQTARAPIPDGVESYLAHILRGRLATCASELSGHLTSAPCTPTSGEMNARQLWTHLNFCAALVAQAHARPAHAVADPPSGVGWQLPANSGSGGRPVIFVMGIGSDHAMVEKLVSTLTLYLNDGREESGYYFEGDPVLIPEPAWSADDYATQCESSPLVKGAIIAQITATGSGIADEFFRRRTWTAIEATALYATCDRNAPTAHGVPQFVWISQTARGENHHVTLTPLTPLATLLALGGAYEEFAPARSATTTSTRIYPIPKPTPGTGYTASTVTSNTTTLNASGLGSFANSLVGTAVVLTNNVAPLAQPLTVDQETWDTLQSVAIGLVGDMNCWQPRPQAISAPNVQDVVGGTRALPAYNPPAGLGAYSSGRPSAPFCSEPPQSESINDILP